MIAVYEEPKSIDKAEFLKAVASGVTALKCDAIVRAVHFIDDYNWLLQQYRVLLKHPDLKVRRVTVTCIGHLARINKSAKKEELLDILEPLLPDNDLVGWVEDAVEDVNTFL